MSPMLKKILWKEWLHQSGLLSPTAWAIVFAVVALFGIVGGIEKGMM